MRDTIRALRPQEFELHFIHYSGEIWAPPLSQNIRIPGSEAGDHEGHALWVDWAAMTRQSCRLLFCLHKQDLRVADPTPLPRIFGPWQLLSRNLGPQQLLSGAKNVHGLPPSRPTTAAYFLQNAAANAAGWHDSLEPLGLAAYAQASEAPAGRASFSNHDGSCFPWLAWP